jgi:hypothetical protein
MGNALEQFDGLAVEDKIRWAIRDVNKRREFKDRFPAYNTEALRTGIAKCDEEIQLFEQQIAKAMARKREYQDLLAQCERRDDNLLVLAKRRDAERASV